MLLLVALLAVPRAAVIDAVVEFTVAAVGGLDVVTAGLRFGFRFFTGTRSALFMQDFMKLSNVTSTCMYS